MNIREAKQEVKNTIEAYLAKDETGAYEIPVERQRPILLIGPPGIGKTAIMEQVARECGINLVSYTITHHTRQSAIGLPFIASREYGGKTYSVTEYTMSEIIASVYDKIESTGIQEGILFLDEINCVSETLAPTMLQFLQYKTFGSHRIPDGFIVVTAGNPPQYNKSVHDFDIVTLDRVKRIYVNEDFAAWKEYARSVGIHGSIVSYLEIKKENFYRIRTDVEETHFVTARGWEDLSRMICVYEKLGKPVNENLVVQYLQDPDIARDFAVYYELYNRYRDRWRVPEILSGEVNDGDSEMRNAPFDEKLSLIGLLIDSLNQEFRQYAIDLTAQQEIFGRLQIVLNGIKSGQPGMELVGDQMHRLETKYSEKREAGQLTQDDEKGLRLALIALKELEEQLKLQPDHAGLLHVDKIHTWFEEREEKRQDRIKTAGAHLTNCFRYLSRTFGEEQEMVIFLSELAAGYYSLKFVSECGNDEYYRYNRLLLLKDNRQQLQSEIRNTLMQL